ncbi:MAG: phoR [Acidimicrobiaceae bacterium]|nr:phoR [Acidimicrobiaceae bacterium]
MSNRWSLRVRILIAVGAISLLALGVGNVVVFSSLHSYLYNQVDNTLASSEHALQDTISPDNGTPDNDHDGPADTDEPSSDANSATATPPAPPVGNPAGAGASAFCDLGREMAPGLYVEVRSAAGKTVTTPTGPEKCPSFQPGSTSYSPKLPAHFTGFKTRGKGPPTAYLTVASTKASGPEFRVEAVKLNSGGVLIVASPINNIENTLSQLMVVELAVTGGALLGAILLGLWLVRVGLRPLRDVERTAEAIAGGDLEHRAPHANARTEVGRMAGAFNVMLERIETLVGDLRSSEHRLRRFVSDASHELRTPIAAVSAYAQLYARGAVSEERDVQRVMRGIERESGRMGRLVEDLLLLAKLDEHRPFDSEPVELVGLAAEAVETSILVGPDWPVTLVAGDSVEVLGDRGALRQVLDNLLGNVRSHTPAGTQTTVNVSVNGSDAILEVADNGPGITEEQSELIFERFFRSDASRSRETGGAGLGLSIVAAIVHAHGGRVEAVGRPGGGAVFRVTLPSSQEVSEDEEGAASERGAPGSPAPTEVEGPRAGSVPPLA